MGYLGISESALRWMHLIVAFLLSLSTGLLVYGCRNESKGLVYAGMGILALLIISMISYHGLRLGQIYKEEYGNTSLAVVIGLSLLVAAGAYHIPLLMV